MSYTTRPRPSLRLNPTYRNKPYGLASGCLWILSGGIHYTEHHAKTATLGIPTTTFLLAHFTPPSLLATSFTLVHPRVIPPNQSAPRRISVPEAALAASDPLAREMCATRDRVRASEVYSDADPVPLWRKCTVVRDDMTLKRRTGSGVHVFIQPSISRSYNNTLHHHSFPERIMPIRRHLVAPLFQVGRCVASLRG